VSDQASAVHGGDRGFAKLEFELNDYPGPVKTSLFGIQHVLVMFTAMVGGPLIVGRLLNLPEETRIAMVSGTMIGCGVATMISALGIGFIGPRLPIVMGCSTSSSARSSPSRRRSASPRR
jgi:xanthine/uracil permease